MIWDNDGTNSKEIALLWDNDGSTSTPCSTVYDNDGTSNGIIMPPLRYFLNPVNIGNTWNRVLVGRAPDMSNVIGLHVNGNEHNICGAETNINLTGVHHIMFSIHVSSRTHANEEIAVRVCSARFGATGTVYALEKLARNLGGDMSWKIDLNYKVTGTAYVSVYCVSNNPNQHATVWFNKAYAT